MSATTEDHRTEEERRDDHYEDFAQTVGGGRLYAHMAGIAKPRPADVATIMRVGAIPPEMILPGWIVKGELHWVFADAEAGKTWLALRLCIDVMAAGGTVVYFDEELGANAIADRLAALGANPEVVAERFVYCPFPGWQSRGDDPAEHAAFLSELAPANLQLVVYDTVTDALAEAELDENKGVDVTKWVKAYPESARKLGAAQLVLDHVAKAGSGGTAVGSRAKRAKAKVQYEMTSAGRFDRERTNFVTVELRKNTAGAMGLGDRRVFEVGGSPAGFVWRETIADVAEMRKAETSNRIHRDIMKVLRDASPLTQNGVLDAVPGDMRTKKTELQWMISNGVVDVEPGPNRSRLHSVAPGYDS